MTKIVRYSLRIVGIVFLICALVFGFRDFLVTTLAYHPYRDLAVAPALDYIEEVNFTTEDGLSIHNYFFQHKDKSSKVVLYFHGNAGNNSHRIEYAQKLYDAGFDVLLAGYRGYGNSDGRVSERGIYKDARAALLFLLKKGYTLEGIYVLGRSIGSTVAVDLVQGQNIGGLVLITPLSSGEDMADAMGMGFVKFIAKNRLDNLSKIRSVNSRVLFIHGDEDKLIPMKLCKKLYDAFPGQKELLIIKGAGHNNISTVADEKYWNAIIGFIHEN